MQERPPSILDYGAFRQPPNHLFRDYLAGAPGAAPFYDGGLYGLEAVSAAAVRTMAHARDRARLAHSLASQQRERGASSAALSAEALADPATVAVVTGQQAGLFGGPLFVLYKAITALKVARSLEEARGARVVPVFWVASDDHDFAEVRSTTVVDESGQLRILRYAPSHEPSGQPAARVILDETITPLVAELEGCLPGGLPRDEVLGRLRECYRPGRSLSGAFASFISSILPDLVVLDPADPALKALMAPVLARELREGSPTSRLAREAGELLLAAGYHQQVPVRPNLLNLFVILEGERRALGFKEGLVEVRGIGRTLGLAEALALLEKDPTPWSPGALLRPLAQDHLLPTAAYVGGPAEVAYHAQIGPSYAHFAIPRPVILPRPSLTLVEPGPARAMDSEGLRLLDLEGDPDALLGRWARDAYPEVESAFARTREALDAELSRVEETLAALDPTLRAAADAARGRALHQIETLHEKATRALKKRDQSRADRVRRTRDALFPGGALQERGLGLVALLARHGLSLIDQIRAGLDPWARGHQMLFL